MGEVDGLQETFPELFQKTFAVVSIRCMEEYIDILNEKGEKTGESRSYQDVHRDGLLHRAVDVWFRNSQGELLLQKRSANKQAYPDYWDISVAGHVSARETSLEAAKRETEEELGLTLPDSAFEYLFTVEEHAVLNNDTYINNEFQDVYLVRSDAHISELKLPVEEVAEVRWISIAELRSWIEGSGEKLVPHEEEYSLLLKRLN